MDLLQQAPYELAPGSAIKARVSAYNIAGSGRPTASDQCGGRKPALVLAKPAELRKPRIKEQD